MSIHRANTKTRHAGRSAFTALAATIAALCLSSLPGYAQFAITTGTGSTAQNFDTLASSGSGNAFANDVTITPPDLLSTLDGWSLFNAALSPVATYDTGTGTANAGRFYSFGSTASTDRALGGVGSGSFSGYIAFAATNNSGLNLASFTLGFDGEQWRNGGSTSATPSVAQSMTLEYGFGTAFTDVTTWIAPNGSFNWASPVFGTTIGSAVDGNNVGQVVGRGGVVSGLSWANGQTLWIRWLEVNDANNDHALAIDNFSLSWNTGAAPKNLIWSPTTNAWDTTVVNWVDETPAPSAFTTGDSVSFTGTGLAQNNVTVAAGGVSPGLVTVSHTSGTYTLSGGAITSNQVLVKTGAGTLVLATTFSQGFNSQGGVVQLAAGGGFGDTSSVTLGNGTSFDLNGNNETVGALDLTGATITTGAGILTLNGNAAIHSSPTNLNTTFSGKLSTGSTPRTFQVTDNAEVAVDLDLDADLSGSGRLGLTGSGTVRIGGDNSAFTGNLQLNSGPTYLIDTDKAFGTNTIFLNGGTLNTSVAYTGTNKITNAVSLGGTGVTFVGEDIDFAGDLTFFTDDGPKVYNIEEGQTITFSGSLAGVDSTTLDIDITKRGLGTLVLRENGSGYTGTITVGDGAAFATTAGSLGTGSVNVVPTFELSTTLTITASQTITSLNIGDGGIVVLGSAAPAEAAPSVVAVPEPGAVALFATGFLGLLARRRTRRA